MSETRKLAAILVADVVGYSRLAGTDEDRTLARLRGLRSDLIDPAIAAHHGHIVKRTGDGSIVEFRSVVDAVRCAIEVQSGLIERNAGVPEDRRIEFRVGIHLGDVVEESDGDLMGDGVNIAARLEGVARPGAICLSEQAYWQVKQRLDLKVSDLGPVQLKNIAEPVHVYSLEVGQPAQARPAPKAEHARSPASKPRLGSARFLVAVAALFLLASAGGWFLLGGRFGKQVELPHLSIVVLPFVNISGDASQNYFADGLTENLTTDLSRLAGAFVIARNTAFTFKGKNIDAKAIGEQLGVRYVLEGSVQRDRDRVRVNVQLISAESGAHLWAQSLDKSLAEVFAAQDEIVASLGSQLGTQLAITAGRQAARVSNPDSMDLYLQGLSALNQGLSKENVANARAFFARALAADPSNVEARIGLAVADVHNGANFFVADPKAAFAAADEGLNRALSSAPDHALGHMWLGFVYMYTKRAPQALVECEHALELDRNLAAAHSCLGNAKIFLGRFEETEAHIEEALRLSPRDTYSSAWMRFAGLAKFGLGDYEGAARWDRRAVEANRNDVFSYFFLAAALAELNRLDEARSAMEVGLKLNPTFSISRMRAAGALSDDPKYLDYRQRLYEGLRKAGAPEQ